MKYQIGDFSKISRLSIKTLRFYHEFGLLKPSYIDVESNYRFYDEKSLEKVKVINTLKEFGFPLKDIKEILDNCNEDYELLEYMRGRQKEIGIKISEYTKMQKKIVEFIDQASKLEELNMKNTNSNLIIKEVPDAIIVSERFKGKYGDIGKYFKKLFKAYGRFVNGCPFSIYYDNEYRDEDADIEACIPVKNSVSIDGVSSRLLKGGQAITIIHQGAYETFGDTYKILLDYINSNKISVAGPCREVYFKGPGIIIPRNPKKYITEIQMFIQPK